MYNSHDLVGLTVLVGYCGCIWFWVVRLLNNIMHFYGVACCVVLVVGSGCVLCWLLGVGVVVCVFGVLLFLYVVWL